ncbi:hypothetical protein GGR50DRAFT_691682 [Xylaria sp. CBS 124048]|nr:hypothetical protein GGR50DRAFT_691682 [Xylaria sp. CBS 124048]
MATTMEEIVRPAWSTTDDETLSLILALAREDILHATSTARGKQKQGSISDAELALQLYAQELDQAATYLADRRMIQSIANALQADINAVLEYERLERVAENDRLMALRLSQEDSIDSRTNVNINTTRPLTATKPKPTIPRPQIYKNGQPESSSTAAARKPEKPDRRPCTACHEKLGSIDLAQAPCGDEYCSTCLNRLFLSAISDETLFPPRCCGQSIPVDKSQLFLSGEMIRQFKKAAIEFSTPNRTYCHQRSCSTFISPTYIKDGVARCAECNAMTCVTCKKAAHRGDCPADAELKKVLQVAKEKRWQRCPKYANAKLSSAISADCAGRLANAPGARADGAGGVR